MSRRSPGRAGARRNGGAPGIDRPARIDRRPYAPRPVAVRVGSTGAPDAVGGLEVEAIREEWVVEDRWWAPRPLRRHYFELVLADGRDVTVFRDGYEGNWYRQRA